MGGTRVTDAVLNHLDGLPALYWICVTDTDVTDEAARAFEEASGGRIAVVIQR